MQRDVIVVGGGVIGCSIAWKLAQRGMSVTILERGTLGCEASRAAAGMLSPQGQAEHGGPFFELCLRGRTMYREFTEELTSVSGIDIEYKDEGTLFVVVEGEDHHQETKWASWQLEAGLPLERVSTDELHRMEPAVTESATAAIFLPKEHQIENRRLMDALALANRRACVEVIEGKGVTCLIKDGNRVEGVLCGDERWTSGLVVLAAGSWSSSLLQPVGLDIRIIPARGEMIAIKGGSCPIQRVIHSSEVYVVPRRDGRILIGATVEYAGFEKRVTVKGVSSMLTAATQLVPSLGGFEIIETWSGLRPDTADHWPIIGNSGIDNLFLATGHFRNGILLAPITAELAAEAIVTGRSPESLEPFSVNRLELRSDAQHQSR